jgi:hypothetical protein
MKFVVLESPYAGNIQENLAYARRALRDCIARGEAPFAPHLLYTQVLNDAEWDQRERGIMMNLSLIEKCDCVAVYQDRGISPGMELAIKHALKNGKMVVYREIEK